MTDQMPDEVWLHMMDSDFAGASPEPLHSDDRRYIRADLHEQVEAERDSMARDSYQSDVARENAILQAREWAQRARAAEAARDRLRAAIEAALTMGISSDIYALIVSIRRRLQEALDHAG